MKTTSFICGCGHTGTSLLANVFAAHPDVFVPRRETECFLNEAEAPSRLSALMDEATASGRLHFVEKTPRHIHKLDLIRSLVPKARMILTIRDGRDVAASFIKRVGSAQVGIDRWIKESSLVRREMNHDDTILVRYEDLIDDVYTQLKRLCEFTGIPYAPAMLEYHKTRRFWFGVRSYSRGSGANGEEHRILRNWQINQPIFDGRGAWKGKLSSGERLALERGPGAELMQHFGYL